MNTSGWTDSTWIVFDLLIAGRIKYLTRAQADLADVESPAAVERRKDYGNQIARLQEVQACVRKDGCAPDKSLTSKEVSALQQAVDSFGLYVAGAAETMEYVDPAYVLMLAAETANINNDVYEETQRLNVEWQTQQEAAGRQ